MRLNLQIPAWMPVAAFIGIAATVPQSLAQTASSTYNRVTYQVTSRTDNYPQNNQEAPWLGDPALAKALANAFKTQLGTVSGRSGSGPSFTYEIVPGFNPSLSDARGW